MSYPCFLASLNIDTEDVLKAAESKWNFLPFKPGLVGGHCIGVDPYYLTHKAKSIGYHPKLFYLVEKLMTIWELMWLQN